jgi:hypothetical protein
VAHLKIGTTQYLHTLPLINRAVSVKGLDYDVTVTRTIDECTLRTIAGDFDAGEFSLATFVKLCETDQRFVAFPVFAKKLVSQYAFCRDDTPFDGHGSLAGRRIAVPQFWVTAALWHRWTLGQSGLAPADVIWCPLSKDRIEGMPYPDQFRYDWSLVGRKPSEILRSGEADCFIFARRPDDLQGLRYLARDPIAATLELTRRTGIIPITHVLAVKREWLAANPGKADAVLELFSAALAHGDHEVGHHVAQYMPLADMQFDQTTATLGQDWNRYGWARNQATIGAFCEAALSQGFVKNIDINHIFQPIG